MDNRTIQVYNELFVKICSKDYLADKFKVSTKTIENTIKACDDVVYSKKLGAYHFKDLLPSYISYHNYFVLFQDNLSNPILKKDMIQSMSKVGTNLKEVLLSTSYLSDLAKKIIKANIAINHNCIIKIYYPRAGTPNEDKYIKPKQIVIFDSIYYLDFEYDKKNKGEGLETRPFAFNGIQRIEVVEYKKGVESFRTNKIGNSFGYAEDTTKKITLKLKGHASYFFLREGLFESPYYNFINADSTGKKVEMQMIYNNDIEVIKLVQQWMPLITVINDCDDANQIINQIKKNYDEVFSY
ncbi:MAG: WYL domain-containing protein [Sulfurovum sp.]